jgi:hypothetical protein
MNPIEALHAAWCSATGQELNPPWVYERLWLEFSAAFTQDDLVTVIRFQQRRNRQASDPRYQVRMNARRLCGDLEEFGSLLAEVRAIQHNRVQRTPAEKVLAARTGGVIMTSTADSSRTVGALLRSMADLAAPSGDINKPAQTDGNLCRAKTGGAAFIPKS